MGFSVPFIGNWSGPESRMVPWLQVSIAAEFLIFSARSPSLLFFSKWGAASDLDIQISKFYIWYPKYMIKWYHNRTIRSHYRTVSNEMFWAIWHWRAILDPSRILKNGNGPTKSNVIRGHELWKHWELVDHDFLGICFIVTDLSPWTMNHHGCATIGRRWFMYRLAVIQLTNHLFTIHQTSIEPSTIHQLTIT